MIYVWQNLNCMYNYELLRMLKGMTHYREPLVWNNLWIWIMSLKKFWNDATIVPRMFYAQLKLFRNEITYDIFIL